MSTRASNVAGPWREKRRLVGWMVAIGLSAGTTMMAATAVQSQEDPARKILKAMSDYVGSQRNLAITFDSDIEIITLELQKLQFTSSGQLTLSRPDKLRASRTGGYNDVEFVFDGRTFTVHDRDDKAYAQAEGVSTVDQLVQKLRNEFAVEAPGADLLLTSSYATLTEEVVDAKHIGQGVIDGVECEHLAFRSAEVDWQIWVQTGPNPIPRKYVITSKAVTGGPQYTLRIKEWRTDPQIAANTFSFTAPAGARKVDFRALAHTDEVPAGTVIGASK